MLDTSFALDPIIFINHKRQSKHRVDFEALNDTDGLRDPSPDSANSRWYCIKAIVLEQYLHDTLCGEKPSYLHSRPEVAVIIQRWLKVFKEGKRLCNCSGCLNCVCMILELEWIHLNEIGTRDNSI